MMSWRTIASTGLLLICFAVSALALPPDWPGSKPDQQLIGDHEKSLVARVSNAAATASAAGSILPEQLRGKKG